MKNKILNFKTLALVTMMLCAIPVFSGNGLFHGKLPDKSFTLSSKSRTIKMTNGETYTIKMSLKNERYYYFFVNGRKKTGCLHYRIIDPSNNTVLFDNSAHAFQNKMLFYNEMARDVIVEVSTMPCLLKLNNEKENNVKLVFANKKNEKNEDYYYNPDFPLYALN